MLGLGKTGTLRALVTASSVRSRDAGIFDRYAAGLYRQALLTLGDSAWPSMSSVTSSSTSARGSPPGRGGDDASYRLAESVFRRCRNWPLARRGRTAAPASDLPGASSAAQILAGF